MSGAARVERPRRGPWRFLLAAKVTFALGVLVLANLAVGLGGLRAVSVTNQQADLLYSESLRRLRDLTDLGNALDHAYQDALRLIPTNSPAGLTEIGRRLDEASIPAVERAIEVVERDQADEEPEARALVQRVRDGWRRFVRLRRSGRYERTSTTTPGFAHLNDVLVDDTARTFAPILAAVDELGEHQLLHAQRAHDRANSTHRTSRLLIAAVLVASLAAAIAVGVWLTRDIVRRIRDYAAFAAKVTDGAETPPLRPHGSDELAGLGHSLNQLLARRQANALTEATQAEFIEMLQAMRGEEEAHHLVKRHLERSIGDCSVVVLNRNNSADRLEPATALAPDSPLLAALEGATPGSCLALRLARTHHQDSARPPLVPCEICTVTDQTTCEPLLVGGEVIGSVMVQHRRPLTAGDSERIADSVAQAAPVLANLRNLALAEFRANNDALTGVPNKRAVHDTLKRMVAQASRSVAPLAAVMLDLDHFKQINDVFGHEKGDEVLAAVGAALRETVRESDFVGRYGGEEFLILLPDTDREGATVVAETLRAAVELVKVPGVERVVTASLGIAVTPDDAGDPAKLVRNADRALFTAKARGRNRVEGGTETVTHRETGRRHSDRPQDSSDHEQAQQAERSNEPAAVTRERPQTPY